MKDINYYIYCFTHLRRAPNLGGAPHKPVILLSIIDAVEKGYIRNERIYITTELISLFKSNWNIWVKTSHIMNFSLPFYHMSGEPFWKIVTKPGFEIELTTKKSVKSFNSLNTTVDYVLIDKELAGILLYFANRELLKQTLIDKYFLQVKPDETSNTYYLDHIAEQILNESAIQYKKRIKDLQKTENYEEEIYLRNNVFKREIPKIYNNTCCITGLKINSSFNISMIDACHIIPFTETNDDTIGNGIALCPNLHRAFDRGLITIDENYRVVVSKSFKEENDCSHSIAQFDKKAIILPQNKLFYPIIKNLRWHNEKVFK